MRLLVAVLFSLAAPASAFACAMYIPTENLAKAMEDVDQAAKPPAPPAQPAQAVPAAQAPVTPPAQAIPEADSKAEPPPTAAPPPASVIPEVSAPAS